MPGKKMANYQILRSVMRTVLFMVIHTSRKAIAAATQTPL